MALQKKLFLQNNIHLPVVSQRFCSWGWICLCSQLEHSPPFMMQKHRKQVSPRPFFLKKRLPARNHRLLPHAWPAMEALTPRYFPREYLLPHSSKPSRAHQWFCLIPWNCCHFWVKPDTTFIFSQVSNCSSLTVGCKYVKRTNICRV